MGMFEIFLKPWDEGALPFPLSQVQPWMVVHGMPLLLCHWHTIALGCVFSLAVSYFGFHVGPLLFPSAFQRGKPSMRLNFAHQLVSFIHAIWASTFSLYNLLTIAKPIDRIHGYSNVIGAQCGLTVGYFLWDLFSTAANIDYYGPAFMLHAIIGFFPLAATLSPILISYVPSFLLVEFSSIFLHSHWFMDKLMAHGSCKKKLLLANDFLLLVTFFAIRIPYYWVLIIEVVQDITKHRHHMGQYFFPFLCFTLASSLTLNHFWFYRLFRATLRHLRGSHRVHHHHHHQEDDQYMAAISETNAPESSVKLKVKKRR